MSAFIVSHDHIDALLTFAKDKRMLDRLSYLVDRNAAKPLTATEIGRVLLAENERSVNYRYREEESHAHEYNFKPFEPFALMQFPKKLAWVLKACSCFDYQACETDDYEQSIARKIIRAIEAKAIGCLPGYEDAPWEINRERVTA